MRNMKTGYKIIHNYQFTINLFSHARSPSLLHLVNRDTSRSRWRHDLFRDPADISEVYSHISQYRYELPCCNCFLLTLYTRASPSGCHSRSWVKSFSHASYREVCSFRILSLYDLWTHLDECDEGVELEYGCDRYNMGNSVDCYYCSRNVPDI